jgi:hypothetical protein
MKQFLLVATAVVLLTTLLPDGAFAQRGGFRGTAIGGGFHGKVGPGFHGKVGPGFRDGGFRRAGWGGPGRGWRRGWDSPAVYGGVGLAVTPGYPNYYGSTIPCIVTEGRKFGFGCP